MRKITSIVLNNFTNDSRVLKENLSLQKAGYDVTVVALHEESLEEFENIQGVKVHRVKLKSINWSKNLLISLFKYLEWSYRIVKQYRKSDFVHCNDLSALPIGVAIKLFNRNVKIVYDAHEYETEVDGLVGAKKTLTVFFEKRLIKYVDKTITVSDAISDEYVRLYGITKPELVLNTPHYKEVEKKNIFREKFNIKENQTIFLYQGSLSTGRGIEILLDTFKELDDSQSVMVFMGYGILEELVKNTSSSYENIYFHEAVSPEILLDYSSSADFGISTIEDSCLSYRYCLPNKMFEYSMAEVPVIVSNLPEMKKVVEKYHLGVVAEENTPKGLKKAIEKAIMLDKKLLREKMKEAKKIYNWEEQEKVLLKVYGELG